MFYAELETIYRAAKDIAEEESSGGRPGKSLRWQQAYDCTMTALDNIAFKNDGELPMFIDELIGENLREH